MFLNGHFYFKILIGILELAQKYKQFSRKLVPSKT